MIFPFKDNGLFITYAFLTPGTDNQKVEDIILKEYSDIIKNGVDQSEIMRAVAQIRATVAFSRDGSYAVASALNEAIAIGDWQFYTTFLEKIKLVTINDITRVAEKYLVEDQSTVGWFIPKIIDK
jgi:zinc protease